MASTWKYTIAVSSMAEQTMTVTGERAEGADVWTYSLSGLTWNETANRGLDAIAQDIIDVFAKMHAATVAMNAKSAEIVAKLESLLNSKMADVETALEAK